MLTPVSPGARPSEYVTPTAAETPALANVMLPLTGVAAAADAGSDTVVVTSASDPMLVDALAVSGSVLAPWLVAVPTVVATVTVPPAGAV